MVDLLLDELRLSELAGEVTIVGEKEHASGVAVETAYWIDTLLACIAHEIHDSLTSLRVIACSHSVLWLVEEDIDLALEADRLIVEQDSVLASHLCTEFCHYLTIDLDITCLDVLISLTARANTCIGKVLVETQFLIWINESVGVFYRTLLVVTLVVRLALWLLTASVAILLLTTITTLLWTAIATILIATLLTTAIATLLWTAITTLLATVATLLWTVITTLLTVIATLLATITTLLATVATLLWTTITTLLATVATLLWTAIATLWA